MITGEKMSEIIKKGAGLFGRVALINVMCFFVVISMSIMCSAAFTENIGYTAYGVKEDGDEPILLYKHTNAEGEDLQKAEYESQGFTITTYNERSDLSSVGNAVFLGVSQVFALLILIAIVYPALWRLGTADSNLVRFKHKEEDLYKGLKIGAVSVIPSALFTLSLIVFAVGALPKFPVIIYKFINSSQYSFIQMIIGNARYASDLHIWQFGVLLLLLLIVPAISTGAYIQIGRASCRERV